MNKIFDSTKIWHIQNDSKSYTDEELIEMIKNQKLDGETRITNRDLRKWIKIKNTIYQFYLPKE